MNDELCQHLQELPHYVTAFLAFLDPSSRSIDFAIAAHVPPLLLSPSSDGLSISPLALKKTFFLGVRSGFEYPSSRILFNPGDRLFLYTDGLTEARTDRTLYGEERLEAILRQFGNRESSEMLDRMTGLPEICK